MALIITRIPPSGHECCVPDVQLSTITPRWKEMLPERIVQKPFFMIDIQLTAMRSDMT